MSGRRIVFLSLGTLSLIVSIVLLALYFSGAPKPGEFVYKINHKPTLMTVAYKAYGNPGAASGKYWLAKLVVENGGGTPIEDVKISFQVPGYITWTTPDTAPQILPGQTVVLAYYPKLPASVTQIRSRTPATLEIKFEYTLDGKREEKVEKREFELRGVNEFEFTSLPQSEIVTFYDAWDNYELLAAYHIDEDEVIKAYVGKIAESMGGLPHVQNGEDLLKLLRKVYEFQISTGMVYTGAKGVPQTVDGVSAMVQSIRLPRDIIQHNSGTCIELAILMNTVLERFAGTKAYLVMIPGHAFTLVQCPFDGSMFALECTGIRGGFLEGQTNRAATFEEAINAGKENIKRIDQGQPAIFIDVDSFKEQGIRPPEMPSIEVASINRMLDERIARAIASAQQANNTNTNPNNNPPVNPDPTPNPNPNPNPNPQPQPQPQPDPAPKAPAVPNGYVVYKDGTGVLNVPYPKDWVANPAIVQQIQTVAPWYQFNATDQNTGAAMESYIFDSNDQKACMQALSNLGAQLNLEIEYGRPQQVKFGKRDAEIYPVELSSNAGVMRGNLVILTIGKKTYAVSITAPTASLNNQVQQTLTTILESMTIVDR